MLEPWAAWSASFLAICSGLSVPKCGAAGSASGRTACPVRPTLHQSLSRQCESSPLGLPVSAPPTGLDECLFFISLVSDFLALRFSVSSGCARRRSVSTYAAILVLVLLCFFNYSLKSSVFWGDLYFEISWMPTLSLFSQVTSCITPTMILVWLVRKVGTRYLEAIKMAFLLPLLVQKCGCPALKGPTPA